MKYYCIPCKGITNTKIFLKIMISKSPMLKGVCTKCGKIKSQLISKNKLNIEKTSRKKEGLIFTLPALIAGATALGSLAGGASAVAKTVNEKKVAQKLLEEARRHNL